MAAQQHRQAQGQLRGIHVFWIISAFFAVTIAVNAFFIVRAVGTFPGEEVEKSYLAGLHYNDELTRKEEQRRLGWSAQAGFTGQESRTLLVRIESRDGLPVSGLNVVANVHMSGAGSVLHRFELTEAGAGEYAVDASSVGVGRAVIEIVATRPGDEAPVFEAAKKVATQ